MNITFKEQPFKIGLIRVWGCLTHENDVTVHKENK